MRADPRQAAANDPVVAVELLRFAAAAMVMACHFGIGFWRAPGARPRALLAGIGYAAPGERWWQVGWLGVEIFFVVSGMMIARSAVGVGRPAFIRARLLRLVPAAWICGTLTLAVLAAASGLDAALLLSWLRSALFWPVGAQIDGSYWTLGIELAFYAAIAGALGRTGTARGIEAVGTAIGLASMAFWAAIAAGGPAAAALCFDRRCALLLLPHGCLFALGVTIASADRAGWTPRRLLLTAALGATAALEIAVHAVESRNDTGVPIGPALPIALFAAALALLIAAGRLQPALARLIAPAAARRLGLTTYPLYLLHQDAGAALVAALVRRGVPPGAALLGAAAAAVAVAGAVATTAEPALRRRLAAVSRRRAPAPDTRPTASLRAG